MMSIRGSIRLAVALGAAAAVVLIAGAVAGVRYTSQSSFCASCHEMQPMHRGWKNGSHARTECYACHVDDTLIGQVSAKANGLRQVYLHFTSKVDMENVVARVPVERCTKCHDMADMGKLGERIVTAHQKHQEAKLECNICHLTSGHTREAFGGFKHASCKECHSETRDPAVGPFLRKMPCDRD
jgi:nitrate/TMAO reductase-like tetraheme cytochrome c subunit